MELTSLFTPEALISLLTLTFLEIVLGVDNIVFITITTNRLDESKQSLGRKLGLAGAFVSRCIFLCLASFLVSMTAPLFTLDVFDWTHGVSLRDLILFVGGAYLVYKGFSETRSVLKLKNEDHATDGDGGAPKKRIGLVHAIVVIMLMDVVFSIDSVITAVGLVNQLPIMIAAVLIAILLMMIFIDTIASFINRHTEMKILALVFIFAIGVLLMLDGAQIHTGIELIGMSLEKVMVYFAMIFSVVLEAIQMRYRSNLARHKKAVASQTESGSNE